MGRTKIFTFPKRVVANLAAGACRSGRCSKIQMNDKKQVLLLKSGCDKPKVLDLPSTKSSATRQQSIHWLAITISYIPSKQVTKLSMKCTCI